MTTRTKAAGRPGLPLALYLALGAAAGAEPVMTFSADDFGKVDLPLRESVGPAVSAAFARNNVYEPIGTLVEDDPLRRKARAVVRLDLLMRDEGGKEFGSTCTAWLVGPETLLTNNHCVPGAGGATAQRGIALFDYLRQDPGGTTQVEVGLEPMATDAELDYTLLRMAGAAPAGIEPLGVNPRDVRPGERLMLIHHPLGQPKVMTRFQCFVHPDAPRHEFFVPHVCDTEPGTSGAPVFDALGVPVALHHRGGLNPNDANSFNLATALRAVAERHPDMLKTDTVAADSPPPQVPADAVARQGGLNAIMSEGETSTGAGGLNSTIMGQ